jgi:hypothetical protein
MISRPGVNPSNFPSRRGRSSARDARKRSYRFSLNYVGLDRAPPLRRRLSKPDPCDEVHERRLRAQFPQSRVDLAAVVPAVRGDLQRGLAERRCFGVPSDPGGDEFRPGERDWPIQVYLR